MRQDLLCHKYKNIEMQNNGFIHSDCSCIHIVDIFYNDYLEQVLGNSFLIFWLKD